MIERELASAERHRSAGGACLWCDAAEEDRADRRRLLVEGTTWQAAVPFAARWPYEVHLQPRRHVGWLHEITAGEAAELATVLRRVLTGYDRLFGFPLPYVMAIHQRPTDGQPHGGYHLHVELYPPHRSADKLKFLAGSEAGAGAFINDTLPEESAAELRAVMPS